MTETFGGFPLTWPLGVPRLRAHERRDSRFKTAFGAARDQLLNELKLLGADLRKGVVISSNVPLRQDGLPYAGQANPADPAVAVYFWLGGKQRVFGCDRYRKVSDNLYAVTLTIEALRGIKRWGTSQMFDQAFTGFTALPPPLSHDPKPQQPWWAELHVSPMADVNECRQRRRELAKLYHPDSGTQPDAARMARINAAVDYREKHCP